jgi:hypothetical protein
MKGTILFLALLLILITSRADDQTKPTVEGLSPAAELKLIYATRCETTIKVAARQLDEMDRAEREAIKASESLLQALDGAWSRGAKVRETYSELTLAVEMHNGWTKAIREIPPAFQLSDSLVDSALAQKHWEGIRLQILPTMSSRRQFGWPDPNSDDKTWRDSPRGRSYEFFTLLQWLQAPPPDAPQFQREWVFREAGGTVLERAMTNRIKPVSFLHGDYEYEPLTEPDSSGWPTRARWAVERLCYAASIKSNPSDFAAAALAKDAFMMDLGQLYLRRAQASLVRTWLIAGSRWAPFFSIFDPKQDKEVVRSILLRKTGGADVLNKLFQLNDRDIGNAIFRAQLVTRPSEFFIPDAPWTSSTPINGAGFVQRPVPESLVQNAAKMKVAPPVLDSAPPERAWRVFCQWVAGELQQRGLAKGSAIHLVINTPRDWRLAFGTAELKEELSKLGLHFVEEPRPGDPLVQFSVREVHAPSRSGEAGVISVELSGDANTSPVPKTLKIPGTWPPWFASSMMVSRREWFFMIASVMAVTLVVAGWSWLRWRPRPVLRLAVLPMRLRVMAVFLAGAGLALAAFLAKDVPVGRNAGGTGWAVWTMIASASLLSALFLFFQWRLWRNRGGAYEGWQRSLPLWCGLVLFGFLCNGLFVWALGPTP